MSFETQGIKLFWRDIPGFCRDIPEAPEKFEKKMFGFNFLPLIYYSKRSFLERKHVCNSQENGVRTRRTAIVNHSTIVNSLRVVNLLCVLLLVQWGPLGCSRGHERGAFVKGRAWRVCPRSGFGYRGTSECTLVPVFGTGEHQNLPSFRFVEQANIRRNAPFGKPPFCEPPTCV